MEKEKEQRKHGRAKEAPCCVTTATAKVIWHETVQTQSNAMGVGARVIEHRTLSVRRIRAAETQRVDQKDQNVCGMDPWRAKEKGKEGGTNKERG